jgi:hypothetical protein
MRVLHLPQNIASLPSHSVRGLRQAGVDASSLILSSSLVQSAQGLWVISPRTNRSVDRRIAKWNWFGQFLVESARADVIHWYYGRPVMLGGLDLAWIAALRKPALVEWMGSDIRIPEVEFADNPYYARAYQTGYEYARTEGEGNSRRAQARFARARFAFGADRGLYQYILPDFHRKPYWIPRRILLEDYEPAYPQLNRTMPLVIHSPTAPVAKGTSAVLSAVEMAQAIVPFEFRLVQGMAHDEAMKLMEQADIILDQFILGDYGMASLEAMAFGKPVVCYIKKSLADLYGPELPVVNATQETLAETLISLLENAGQRQELGRLGRAYVQQYADMKVVAPQMVEIYRNIISKSGDYYV